MNDASATGQLTDLLQQFFSSEELQGFVRKISGSSELIQNLPDSGAPATLARHTVDGLIRRNLVDSTFFNLLRTERPRRLLEIDAVASRFTTIPIGEGTRQTHVILLTAPIGDQHPTISADEVKEALGPRTGLAGELALRIEAPDGTPALYSHDATTMVHKVRGFLEHRVNNSPTNHLSIFAYAPMPLLILLGHTVGDMRPIEVFDHHRHTRSWCWDKEDAPALDWDVAFPADPRRGRPIAVLVQVSGLIPADKVRQVLGPDVESIKITAREPRINLVRTRAQLQSFAEAWRALLNRINAEYVPPQLHVFAAAPLSVCVELGRRILPKADPDLVLYDRFGDQLCPALTLARRSAP